MGSAGAGSRTLVVCGAGRTADVVATAMASLGHDVMRVPGPRDADVARAELVFACGPDEAGIAELVGRVRPGCTVVNTCAPPWESTAELAAAIGRAEAGVVSNPVGSQREAGLEDFLAPDVIVIGADDPAEAGAVADVYAAIPAPIVHTDVRTADLTGPARNGLCAVKRQFFAELVLLCRAVGADVESVLECLRTDRRIGAPLTGAGGDHLGSGERGSDDRLRELAGPDTPPTLRALGCPRRSG
ncbi:UDPglucose 6-dehydrogenase [Saccharopolyspora kobensis]|uniref:UDP-glucose 6-dehydrogenase n=1 Tax=Saccharopolyspora kobensis TaxID=146035 RepID=A0A1H6AEM1_9PSEU|nr:UDP-glucose 6-dehydrogenase [Saccharopolyspora kobensis]SEG46614.1 UDPglucose 6-dehydrogenase [Saccharopolyspora kobensis]SFE54876.1 UDPglucose 6-dehydrogenase [Saccharopolyspora kobensis]